MSFDFISKNLEGCIHEDRDRQYECFVCEKKICTVCAIRRTLNNRNKHSISNYYCPFCFFLKEKQSFLPPRKPNAFNFFSWILLNGKKDYNVILVLILGYLISIYSIFFNAATMFFLPLTIVVQLIYFYTTIGGRKRPLDNFVEIDKIYKLLKEHHEKREKHFEELQ